MAENIVLFGFMGTGKTCVGKKLAERLGLEFVDMDDVIESGEGMSISGIFHTKGEPYFRIVENETAKSLASKSGLVIATGGGVVLNEDNIRVLESTGTGICLNATPEAIYSRVKDETHRPLLAEGDAMKRIRELLDKRAPFYRKVTHQVDTEGLSVDAIVEKILAILE